MSQQIIDAVNAGYVPVGLFYAADMAAVEAALEGWNIYSGCAVTANASTVGTISRTSGNNFFTKTSHGLVAGDSVQFSALGNTTGVVVNTTYFVVATNLTANQFSVATTIGGSVIVLSGATDTSTISLTQVGKFDVAAGVLFAGTTECTYSGTTAASAGSDVAQLGSALTAGQAMWVLIEASVSAGVVTVNFNSGSAATVTSTGGPVKPLPTASRIPLAWIYIPYSATTVDTTTSSGPTSPYVAKLIDARRVIAPHPGRIWAVDNAKTTLTAGTNWATNGTTVTSLLNGGTAFSVPANSLSVNDTFVFTASGFLSMITTASTIRFYIPFGGGSIFDYTTPSLSTSANNRRWSIAITITITSIGSGTSANCTVEGNFYVSAPSASTPAQLGGAANLNGATIGDAGIHGSAHTTGFDSTAAVAWNLNVQLGTASGTGTATACGLRNCAILKTPA